VQQNFSPGVNDSRRPLFGSALAAPAGLVKMFARTPSRTK
jgi:hypothetical protein